MVELAKCLKLVAPSSMTAESQAVWLRAAAEALDGIRALEVAEISAELRRKVTRPAQIVPEVANLVDAERKRRNRATAAPSPYSVEREIYEKADAMRAEAMKHKDDRKRRRLLSDAFEWERQARIDAGLHVRDYPKALNRHGLDVMLPHIRQMGLNAGFLEYRDGQLVEPSA